MLTMLVANAIAYSLGEVGRERAFVGAIDRTQPSDRSHDDVVNHVRGIGDRSNPAWKTAMRESMECGEAADEERLQRADVRGRRAGVEGQRGPSGRGSSRRHDDSRLLDGRSRINNL